MEFDARRSFVGEPRAPAPGPIQTFFVPPGISVLNDSVSADLTAGFSGTLKTTRFTI